MNHKLWHLLLHAAGHGVMHLMDEHKKRVESRPKCARCGETHVEFWNTKCCQVRMCEDCKDDWVEASDEDERCVICDEWL